jgi:AcrR family transcriptional regulator
VVTRVMRRKANCRHMTGDHHGRGAGRATLLVRAVDGILGTHNSEEKIEYARLLKGQGRSLGQIAARTGIPKTSLHRYLASEAEPAGQR